MFYCIPTVWYTETKFKIEALQHTVLEEMFLYHPELIHRLIPNYKLYTEKHFLFGQHELTSITSIYKWFLTLVFHITQLFRDG